MNIGHPLTVANLLTGKCIRHHRRALAQRSHNRPVIQQLYSRRQFAWLLLSMIILHRLVTASLEQQDGKAGRQAGRYSPVVPVSLLRMCNTNTGAQRTMSVCLSVR
jgi:hypothetical protein